mmetsp:Transcript_31113/g.89238  ORF Transcript_31113/g.89238 Transcript_31113/m.89238 type:complete len:176 (-) Transcript_31113:218-745(-)
MGRRIWKVIGGADKGGIIVRDGQDLGSAKLEQRLVTGALVSEEEVVGERLRFVRLSGSGPEKGWVSARSDFLSPYEHEIMREGGTDPPGSHPLCHFFPKDGYFACAACNLPLYSCTAKFQDHGWPAWDKCFYSEEFGCHVGTKYDGAVENHCVRCKSHLGHIFFGEHRTVTDERH